MNKFLSIIFVAALFSSQVAFAETCEQSGVLRTNQLETLVKELGNASTGKGEIVTINSPRTPQNPEMKISTRSNYDGVCIALGFTSALKGSVMAQREEMSFVLADNWELMLKTKSDAIVINSDGTFRKQVFSYTISSIKCIR